MTSVSAYAAAIASGGVAVGNAMINIRCFISLQKDVNIAYS